MKARILIMVIFLIRIIHLDAQDIWGGLNPNDKPLPPLHYGKDKRFVGKINDNLEVGLSGLLNYEIPISVPAGTGGMTPQLSLSYTSTQGDGLLGSGFELGGLSVINRCPGNLHNDGFTGSVNLVNDYFMLDGQRLHDLNQNNSGREFRTENNSFSQILTSGGTVGSPTTFTVKTKSGLIYEYSSNDSPLTRATAGDKSIFWLLTKVSDTKSNYYKISYGKDDMNGEYWPTRIDYTGNTSAGLAPYNSIRFDYTTSYTPQDAFVCGIKVRRSKIITGINIYSGEKRVKYYQMAYQTVNNNRQLTSVTEFASDGNMKRPTEFTWHNSTSYVTSNVNYDTTSQINKANVHIGDFNGDGKSDFLLTPKPGANWGGWKLFLSNGNSFSYHSSGGFSLGGEVEEVVVGDFNGDGYSDFVLKRKYDNKYHNSDLYLAKVTGNSVTFTFSKCFLSDTRDYAIRCAEFSGDGAADIFIGFYNSKECLMIRSEEGVGNAILPLNYTARRFATVNWDTVDVFDFDGNGLTDIMNRHAGGYVILTCDGGGTGEETKRGTWPDKNHHVAFGDFNGDGKTDMLITGWNQDPNPGGWSSWAMNYSKGDGTFERYDFNRLFNSKDKHIFVADITGDGRDDFYAVDYSVANNAMSKPYGYINDGTGKYFSQVSGGNTYGLDKWTYYLGDYNGDGKTDFLCTANFSSTFWTGYQLFLIPETTYNLLASVTDGMGVMTEITYKPMSNSGIYTRSSSTYSYPMSTFASSWYLVDKLYTPNGIGGKNITSFKYKNALIHRRGRGFVGFEYFTQKDETNNVETITQMEVSTEGFIGAIKSVEKKVAGKTLNKVEFSNAFRTGYCNNDRIFTYVNTYTKEQSYEYNSGILLDTTENTFEYDNYGNVTKQVTTTAGGVITTTNTYVNDERKWFLGRLTKSIANKKNSTEDITLGTSYAYDQTSGMLVREEYDPGDPALGYSITYIHDQFGNIIESTTNPQDTSQPVNKIKTAYDPTGRFIVKTIDNKGDSIINTINYDLGVVISTKDPNNLVKEYEYNLLGELQNTKTAISYEKITYNWAFRESDAPSDAVFYKTTEVKGIAPILEFYDMLGRIIRTVTVGFNSQKIYTDVIYNAKGQIEKTSEPYFSGQTVYWNRNEYDNIGRMTKQDYADNSAYTFQYYGFESTTTDPLGNKTIKKKNIFGNLVESTDAKAGKVSYMYDISKNCTKIISPRTTIECTYDKAGNKKTQNDPDLGILSYTYNCYGEPLTKTSNGVNTTYQYDALGRVKKEINSDGEISYTYDARWKGALNKISSSNGTSEEYFYDSYGRLIKKVEVVDGKTLTTETTYNTLNNLPETTTYPSGLKVKNEYDNAGRLIAVKNLTTGYTYWTANKRNARGQLESITYGNKLTTNVTYDVKKGYITEITTGGIQSWSYAFNAAGNLTDRRNNLRLLNEHFEYDELHRLTKVSHNGALKQEMKYDAAGNLTYKTGVGSLFMYEPYTNRLISVAGGGYVPKEWDQITYTANNKVSYISSGNNSQSITYGPAQERKKTVTVVDGVIETKYYCGGLYEEVIKGGEVKKINHIFADGESIAIFEQSSVNGDKLFFLHKDHLGSIQALTNEAGVLVQELSYDAWGKRRNPLNWEDYGSISGANSMTPRGFTGHEHMDMFDIVNMDGRMYDPVLGRFLSPDPFAQAPDDTQGLNRYIYCMNNPLSLFDPSGYSWFSRNWKSLFAAVVGIVVTVVTAGSGIGPCVAMIAGAAGGAAAGLTGALLTGANLGQIVKSTLTGAFWGAIGGFLANASGGGQFLERLFKHTFSQAWLEGIRGGNMAHGLLAGSVSVVGGQFVGKNWSKAGKVAANAVISGTAAELGGGKFANGAITGAFSLMFNDLMHPTRIVKNYKPKAMGQLPLEEKPGLLQSATYQLDINVIEETYDNGSLILTVTAAAGNTMVSGDVSAAAAAELIIDGKVVATASIKRNAKYYITDQNFIALGETSFYIKNPNDFQHISLNIMGNWSVEVSPGHRYAPAYYGTFLLKPILIKQKHIYK